MARRSYKIGRGIDKYIQALESVELQGREIIGPIVYEGAAVVADKMKEEINNLPTQVGVMGTSEHPLYGITYAQKKGLQDGFGISKMQDTNGNLNVKLGFQGYNTTITKKYPKGQPNSLIARSVASGTSFRQKNDFVERAVKASRRAAENAMKAECDKQFAKAMKTKGA